MAAKVFAFIDVDIADSRASFKRAFDFVESSSIKYGLSSPILYELGGRERLSVSELYENDFVWKSKGPCLVDPQPATRLVFELNTKESPLATENFLALCTHSRGKSKSSGVELTYRGSKIHRHVPGFILQGGDITFGNGSGGESVFGGKKFKDDVAGLKLKHDARGVLSMGNSGKNSNSSQFFVTLAAAPACNGKHVVLGRLAHGADALSLIEARLAAAAAAVAGAPASGGDSEAPLVPLVVTACGEWVPGRDLEQGYWAEDDTFRPLLGGPGASVESP